MKRCKTHLVRVCVFLLAAVPAYCQRGTLGIDIGQTSDQFDTLPSVNGLGFGIDGQVTVLKATAKRPSIVAGGEILLPRDTGSHPREYALFGGPRFQVRDLSIGFNAQVRRINLPTAFVDNQFFNRYGLGMLEIPLVIKYNFLSSKRAYIEVQGAPEFTPHFRKTSSVIFLPHPNWDHGYYLRGSVGYNFGSWYAKATYQTRYFRFVDDPENPNGLYNWKSSFILGGVGFSF